MTGLTDKRAAPIAEVEDRLAGLDLLRGVAAIVVLFMHAVGFAGGHLAVDFFFMLSGFVMARTYERRLSDGRITPAGFLARRYRRLWPMMAVGATLGLGVQLFHQGFSLDLLLAYAFALVLLPGSGTVPYMLNLPTWSIFYELLANALHGALFARRSTAALALGLAGCTACFLLAYAWLGYPRILGETTPAMQVAVIFRVVMAYLVGVIAFRLWGDRPPFRVPLAVGVLMLPAYCLLVALAPFAGWPLPFLLVCGPLMLVSGLGDAREGSAAFLGALSFPLYAIHFPILQMGDLLGIPPLPCALIALAGAALWVLPDASRTRRAAALS